MATALSGHAVSKIPCPRQAVRMPPQKSLPPRPLILARALPKLLAKRPRQLLRRCKTRALRHLIDLRRRLRLQEMLRELQSPIANVLVRALFERLAKRILHPPPRHT